MPPGRPFTRIAYLAGFTRSLKKIPIEIRPRIDEAIEELLSDPIPGKYDFKKLNGYRNPNIYTITIGGNHAYKISLEIVDGCAVLRRAGTHKQIDNGP